MDLPLIHAEPNAAEKQAAIRLCELRGIEPHDSYNLIQFTTGLTSSRWSNVVLEIRDYLRREQVIRDVGALNFQLQRPDVFRPDLTFAAEAVR